MAELAPYIRGHLILVALASSAGLTLPISALPCRYPCCLYSSLSSWKFLKDDFSFLESYMPPTDDALLWSLSLVRLVRGWDELRTLTKLSLGASCLPVNAPEVQSGLSFCRRGQFHGGHKGLGESNLPRPYLDSDHIN